MVGKSYHLKICDFGSDNPIYGRDYYEMGESHLLIPIRWMASESVVMVRKKEIDEEDYIKNNDHSCLCHFCRRGVWAGII